MEHARNSNASHRKENSHPEKRITGKERMLEIKIFGGIEKNSEQIFKAKERGMRGGPVLLFPGRERCIKIQRLTAGE